MESGTIIGLTDKNEEYQESRSSNPVISLVGQLDSRQFYEGWRLGLPFD